MTNSRRLFLCALLAGLSSASLAGAAHGADTTRFVYSKKSGFSKARGCRLVAVTDGAFKLNEMNGEIQPVAQAPASSRPVADYVFHLSQNPENRRQFKSLKGRRHDLANTFWQASMTGNDAQVLECDSKKGLERLPLFDVFVPSEIKPVMQVGIEMDSLSLVTKARVLTPDQAEKEIAQLASSANRIAFRSTHSTSVGNSVASENPPTEKNRVDLANDKKDSLPQMVAVPKASKTGAAEAVGKVSGNSVSSDNEAVPVVNGYLQYVVCSDIATVPVYDEKIDKPLFVVEALDDVKPVQSWSGDRKSKTVAGVESIFVKMQFPSRPARSNTGWVDSKWIATKSSCAHLQLYEREMEREFGGGEAKYATGGSGIDGANCCNFPMAGRPVESYLEGMRRFRARRDGGRRIHAACDLYRPHGEVVTSVSDGVVIRGAYPFYQGVYEVQVRHTGGFVARYGEVLGRTAAGIAVGHKVTQGQPIGYVGTVNSGCCSPMMHFELYSGRENGPLSQPWRRGFQRRGDLMDPTPYLLRWEKSKFGSSW